MGPLLLYLSNIFSHQNDKFASSFCTYRFDNLRSRIPHCIFYTRTRFLLKSFRRKLGSEIHPIRRVIRRNTMRSIALEIADQEAQT